MQETWVWSLGWAWQPTSVFLPGESPWTEKPGRPRYMGLPRVRHEWATKHSTAHMGYIEDCIKKRICGVLLPFGRVVVQLLSLVWLFVIPWTGACQASLSFTIRVCSNSCLLSQWHHPTISSSVAPFSSCPQSFPASGSFPMSVLFASGGQSTGACASASVPSNEYSGLISFRMDWFDLLSVQGTLKNLLQFKELILWNCSAGEDCAYGLTDFLFKCL